MLQMTNISGSSIVKMILTISKRALTELQSAIELFLSQPTLIQAWDFHIEPQLSSKCKR